jgi:hypothetical protein
VCPLRARWHSPRGDDLIRSLSAQVLVLAPCALGEDQPHADQPEGRAIDCRGSDPLAAACLYAVLEELGTHLYHDIEFAHIQGRLLSQPDLYV